MEEEIQNYSQTVMFNWPPCTYLLRLLENLNYDENLTVVLSFL